MQKVGAYRDPRLYALNVFADQFSKSAQPLVPSRLFISGGGKDGDGQSGSVLETLLNLILSEKAGINITENEKSSRPLEDFIQRFASGEKPNGDARSTSARDRASTR